MINKYILILVFSVFISSCSQTLLKISADKPHKSRLREYLNPYVIVSYGIFFISTLLTVIAYKGVDLKYGPIIEASGYIFILLIGRLLLKEKITRNKLLGIVVIMIGIYVFSMF